MLEDGTPLSKLANPSKRQSTRRKVLSIQQASPSDSVAGITAGLIRFFSCQLQVTGFYLIPIKRNG